MNETAPFDNPGVTQIDEDTYQVAVVAMAFGYNAPELKVPVGKEIIFKLTSTGCHTQLLNRKDESEYDGSARANFNKELQVR